MQTLRRRHQSADEPRLARWIGDLVQDARYSARQLARAPGHFAFIVAALAVGIGGNVAMAGIIDRMMLQPPPGLHDHGRLARLVYTDGETASAGSFGNYPLFLEYQQTVDAFSAVAAESSHLLPLGGDDEFEEVDVLLASASYFHVLGAKAALGRLWQPNDGFPEGFAYGGPAVAVLEHGFWLRRFGGDSNVIGRALSIGAQIYTVTGIAEPGFKGISLERPAVWLPLTVAAETERHPGILADPSSAWLRTVARLRPGASRSDAGEQATAAYRRVYPEAFASTSRAIAAPVVRGRGPDAPREVRSAVWLAGVSVLLLLITCANVANLLLARVLVRRREFAIRLALGAGRGRLARQLLAESMLLAAIGGIGAIALAALGSGVLRGFLAGLGDDGPGGLLNLRMLVYTGVTAIGTAVLISLLPLMQSAVRDLTTALRTGAAAGGGRRSRVRSVLLGVQAALCTVLLFVAGLFAQSFQRVGGLDLGMDLDSVFRIIYNVPRGSEGTFDEIMERVNSVPGVERVARVGSGMRAVSVHTADRDVSLRISEGVPIEVSVDSGYFGIIGASLRGRDFESTDVSGAPPVTVISGPLARALFPGSDALGKCIHLPMRGDEIGGQCWTVVGVLDGLWYPRSILHREGLMVYVPLSQRPVPSFGSASAIVSVSGSPREIAPALHGVITSVLPNARRVRVEWMRDVAEQEIRPWRLSATVFSLFGVAALMIAAVGLYAVVAFTATQRASEIAVRVALGARSRNVILAVAGDGLRSVAVGLAIGMIAALGLRSWLGGMLFQTSPHDPFVMGGVAALLFVTAVAATVVPTLRTLKESPARILRID